MKRSNLFLSIIGTGLAGLLAISGCVSPTKDYQVQQFAQLRVMNFAPNCTAPMDVYWDTKTPLSILGNNAKIYNLQYGGGAVYTNSLAASSAGTDYYFALTPTRIPSESDFPQPIDQKLTGGGKYTLMITLDPTTQGKFLYSFIQDANVPNPDPSLAYVRFINMEPGSGPLSVHVDDPATGTLITPTPRDFNQVSPYTTLRTALDTSFAFLVTNASNQVLARLSYQTFVGGSFYTLIYAGDPCNTVATHPADTSISALDTFRLRAFDDNSTGNDLTNPIQYSYRYNIVNDIYPIQPYDVVNNPPVDTVMGFLVNGEGFPEHAGYSIDPVEPLAPGGAFVGFNSGVYNVTYQSAILANPLDVKGFITNASGTSQRQVLDWSLANPANSIAHDKPVTLMVYGAADTVAVSTKPFWAVQGKVVPVPDESYSDSVTFVFVDGINSSPKQFGTSLYTYFYISQNGGAQVQPPVNGYNLAHAPVVMRFPVSGGLSFTINDAIGTGSNQVQGPSQTIQAQAGGIYEVISTGIKTDNHLLLMQVNAQNP